MSNTTSSVSLECFWALPIGSPDHTGAKMIHLCYVTMKNTNKLKNAACSVKTSYKENGFVVWCLFSEFQPKNGFFPRFLGLRERENGLAQVSVGVPGMTYYGHLLQRTCTHFGPSQKGYTVMGSEMFSFSLLSYLASPYHHPCPQIPIVKLNY